MPRAAKRSRVASPRPQRAAGSGARALARPRVRRSRRRAVRRRRAQLLEALRLAAIEDRIDADLALGREHALIGELERLVVAEPLRERPRAQLMIALYRAGRQSEALEVYQQRAQAPLEQAGIEPGPSLKQLERAILRQDGSLEAATRV